MVTLNATASSDPDGAIVSYRWSDSANRTLANGPTPTVRLVDGLQTVTLTVTDNSGATATDTLDVRITAPATNQLPVASAGADVVIPDTDNQAGESLRLDASASRDPDGSIATYEWLVGANTVLVPDTSRTYNDALLYLESHRRRSTPRHVAGSRPGDTAGDREPRG